MHAHAPTVAERTLAEAVLEHAPVATSYARVDLVSHEGRPVLMELEAIEPELFLGATPDAAENFAAELAHQLEVAQARGEAAGRRAGDRSVEGSGGARFFANRRTCRGAACYHRGLSNQALARSIRR